MTDFGGRVGIGDMLKSVYDPNADGVIAVAQTEADMTKAVYDPNADGVIAVAQTEADMTKAVYDPALANIITSLEDHHERHEDAGDDEIDCSGLAGIPVAPLLADGTPGRVPRQSTLLIKNGTTGVTLKCELLNRWNGDAIAETDNIAKNQTTGHFTLDAAGVTLTIEAAGLSGNPIQVLPVISYNKSGTDLTPLALIVANDIVINLYHATNATTPDITTLVNTGGVFMYLLYITDA